MGFQPGGFQPGGLRSGGLRQQAAFYSRDVWLLAERLIARHGPRAALHAAERTQTLLEEKQIGAAVFWRQAMNAIRDWDRPEPEPDERRH